MFTLTSYVRWDNDYVRFVLSQHVISDYHSASSLKQPLVGKSDNTMAKGIRIKKDKLRSTKHYRETQRSGNRNTTKHYIIVCTLSLIEKTSLSIFAVLLALCTATRSSKEPI